MQERLNTLHIKNGSQIPLSEFELSFARSGGPGGQNVNKVNSKAILRWRITDSPSLPASLRDRFIEKFGSRMTADGDFIITSQTYRDQTRNIDECLRKLGEMLDSIAHPPKLRRATKPSMGVKVRRAHNKSQNSAKKQSRRAPRMDD